jgi:hypothetical protein
LTSYHSLQVPPGGVKLIDVHTEGTDKALKTIMQAYTRVLTAWLLEAIKTGAVAWGTSISQGIVVVTLPDRRELTIEPVFWYTTPDDSVVVPTYGPNASMVEWLFSDGPLSEVDVTFRAYPGWPLNPFEWLAQLRRTPPEGDEHHFTLNRESLREKLKQGNVDLTDRTLQNYSTWGLLPVFHEYEGGPALYSDDAADRVTAIVKLGRYAGLKPQRIRELISPTPSSQ